MYGSTDLVLDDILSRSLRLKSPMNFRIPPHFECIRQQSQKILSDFNDKNAQEDGLDLLARQRINDRPVDIKLATNNLKDKIDISKIIPNENPSFSTKCAEALKASISESINKSSEKVCLTSSDFVFSNLAQQMKANETLIHRKICQPESVSISRFDSPQNEDEKMDLTPLATFYNEYLFGTDYIHTIESVIRSEDAQQYFQRDVQISLADTYSIIDCLSQEKSPLLGSLRYLSILTRRVIKNEVNKNRGNINRGGEIGLIPTIKTYVKLQNYPFKYSPWAVLYFAIRCDVRDELDDFFNENRKIFSGSIRLALENYFNQLPLEKSVVDELENIQSRDVTMQKIDPFKTIILSILTKKHIIPDSSSTIKSFEEWLWIRMQYIHGDNSESNDGFKQLQEEFKDYKPDDPSNPFLFGQLYLLINQYQKAAEWFLKCEDNVDDCLHVVIAMKIAKLIDDSCLMKPLLLYAKDVFRSNQISAIRYLSLLSKESRIEAISRLTVEVKNGEEIFIPLRNELPPISNVITPDEQHQINLRAAQLAEYRGIHYKAALLYSLVPLYDHVLDHECIELRKYIEGFLDDSVLKSHLIIYNKIKINTKSVSFEKFNALRILMCFAYAYLHAHKGEFSEAVEQVEKADFLPISTEDVQPFREKLMANSELRKALPKMLIVAIKSYAELFKSYADSRAVKPGTFIKNKEKAEAIIELTSDIDIPNYAQEQILNFSLEFQ